MSVNAFHGIYAATVTPMHDDFSIDAGTLSKHLASIARVDGIRGLLINGHAGENFALSRSEKRQVIEIARASVPSDCQLIAGVNAENSLDAVHQAHDAAAAGADAVLIFPPNSWALGYSQQTVITHHQMVIDACNLSIMLYQAPVTAGNMAYPEQLLCQLVQLPRVIAIKEGSWEVAAYENHRRQVKKIMPECAVMASGDEHLLTSMVVGSDGSQVSLASLIPEQIVALDRAVRAADLTRAREQHDTIYPLAKAIYGTPPAGYATARLKACLQLLGRIPGAATRPPTGPLPADEIALLRQLLVDLQLHE